MKNSTKLEFGLYDGVVVLVICKSIAELFPLFSTSLPQSLGILDVQPNVHSQKNTVALVVTDVSSNGIGVMVTYFEEKHHVWS